MDKLSRVNKRFDRLWAEAEKFVVAYFNSLKEIAQNQKGKKYTIYKVPDMRQFSYVVSCLKRIQEGRRLANLGVQPGEDESSSNSQALHNLQREISQVISQLQENNANKEASKD